MSWSYLQSLIGWNRRQMSASRKELGPRAQSGEESNCRTMGLSHENAMDDAFGLNAFLYTVSKISQNTAMETELIRSGALKSNCRKNMYRAKGRIPVIRLHCSSRNWPTSITRIREAMKKGQNRTKQKASVVLLRCRAILSVLLGVSS